MLHPERADSKQTCLGYAESEGSHFSVDSRDKNHKLWSPGSKYHIAGEKPCLKGCRLGGISVCQWLRKESLYGSSAVLWFPPWGVLLLTFPKPTSPFQRKFAEVCASRHCTLWALTKSSPDPLSSTLARPRTWRLTFPACFYPNVIRLTWPICLIPWAGSGCRTLLLGLCKNEVRLFEGGIDPHRRTGWSGSKWRKQSEDVAILGRINVL